MDGYISPAELDRLERVGPAPTIIDVRGPEEYGAGHLPGALNIPADQLQKRLADIPTTQPVVTY